MARGLVVLLASLVAGSAAPAFAQAPFSPLPPGAPATTPTQSPPAPTSSGTSSGGLSGSDEILIFLAAVGVLAAIAMVIVRDARRAAPVKDRPAPPASADRRAQRARRARATRAKAKAARRQRRRNR